VDCYQPMCDRQVRESVVFRCVCVCVTEGHCACLQHLAVSLSAETDRSTTGTRDQVKRSSAQTVKLKDAKQCQLNL